MLLALAMLAARFVPAFAIDVPDTYLIDLDRLAVTAWSARDRPRAGAAGSSSRGRGRRGGARGRDRHAAAAAIVAVASVAAVAAGRADLPIDRIGAALVFLAAGAAARARSYRHAAAGCCCGWRGWLVLGRRPGRWCRAERRSGLVPAVAVALAALMVAGRGRHRSGLALGLVVAAGRGRRELCFSFGGRAGRPSGFFRILWESTS